MNCFNKLMVQYTVFDRGTFFLYYVNVQINIVDDDTISVYKSKENEELKLSFFFFFEFI